MPMSKKKRPEDLRSHRWLGVNDLRSFGHRSRLRQGGFDAADWTGKPVIGIVNTWSDMNFCHTHLRARAEDVKRGVLQAGGFPVELPAMSLSEPFVKPSTMLYRNLLAMETEELLRSHPIDGAVLLGGCDKTTPGLIMGGSTNAIIHVVAMARSAGIALDMKRFDEISREIPVLANVRPSGNFLMEDFFYAGGLRALMAELKDALDLSCITVTGKTIGENIAGAEVYKADGIHPLNEPVSSED